MANDNISGDTGRVWGLMRKIGFAMLVTRDGRKLRPDLGDNRKVAM